VYLLLSLYRACSRQAAGNRENIYRETRTALEMPGVEAQMSKRNIPDAIKNYICRRVEKSFPRTLSLL